MTETDIVPVRLPDGARVFEARAARFRVLALSHTMGDYLAALAALAQAQSVACGRMPVALDRDALVPGVPLKATEWRRTDAWRHALRVIVTAMPQVPLPAPALEAVAGLAAASDDEVERAAHAVLAGNFDQVDVAATAFISAALQVYWTALASLVPLDRVAPLPDQASPETGSAGGGVSPAGEPESASRCPLCGSPPVTALVLADQRLRYFSCALCATQWYLPRLTCARCGSTAHLTYCTVEGVSAGLKAEACSACRTYSKLFYLEQMPSAEPCADDVATLMLDLLLSKEGYARYGINYFLLSHGAG